VTPDELGLPQLEHGSVVTVGTFDGVHLGHRDILRRVAERAAAGRIPGLLVTFRPHPLAVVNPSAAPMMLTPGEEQLDALADSGPLLVSVLPFSQSLASYSAEAFVSEILVKRYHVHTLVVGHDHGLGRGRQGDVATLRIIGERLGFDVDIVSPTLDEHGLPISSSSVRTSIAHGDLERARAALGRPYSFRGTVVTGDGRGRQLSYPTINIRLPSARKLLPPPGVYAVRAMTRRGSLGGMMNLGPRPTFGDYELNLEVHLFDTTGDWYGEQLSIDLVRRLRDTVRFSSVDALIEQLGHDADEARFALTQA